MSRNIYGADKMFKNKYSLLIFVIPYIATNFAFIILMYHGV